MTYSFQILHEGTLDEVCEVFYKHPWFQVLWACEGTRVSPKSKGVYWQSMKNPTTIHGHLNVQPELTYLPMNTISSPSTTSASVVARQWTTFHCEGSNFSGCARYPERSSSPKHLSAVELRANCYGHCTAAVAVSLFDTVRMCYWLFAVKPPLRTQAHRYHREKSRQALNSQVPLLLVDMFDQGPGRLRIAWTW
jgi:hypothetical protein